MSKKKRKIIKAKSHNKNKKSTLKKIQDKEFQKFSEGIVKYHRETGLFA